MPEFDVVVVGGGFAGMSAALSARGQGAKVAIVSKLHPLRSHSSGSHSGINAAIRGDDSWEIHANDTVIAGDYLCDQEVVEALCREAAESVIRLEHMGVPFSRDGEGRIHQIGFAGSTLPRTCYCGDSAGHVLLQVLFGRVSRSNIPIYHERFVTSLIADNEGCCGVLAREMWTGALESFPARAVVLATGGIGRIYHPSTSSMAATADGLAMAYRAGAALRDMEMVQFSPTTLGTRGLLITEAAREVGAHLVNARGDRFMEAYAPGAMELATRDVCARAVETEIANGSGNDESVFLDFRHLDEGRIAERLPETLALIKDLAGVDPVKDLVPVRPAMHRPIGGIKTDAQGATSLQGLYAAGECANTGVHGANRLGGNSMLECVVMGRRAGESAAHHAGDTAWPKVAEALLADEEERLRALFSLDRGNETAGGLSRELAALMQKGAGIFRDEKGLREAANYLGEIRSRYQGLGADNGSGLYDSGVRSNLELGNMLDIAQVILVSALARQESRGVHHRTDFPERNDADWLKHTIARQTPCGPQLEYEPVTFTHWRLERDR